MTQDLSATLTRLERLLREHLNDVRAARNAEGRPLTILELFKRAGEATVILAALFYVVGWSHLEGYYTAFGINLSQLPVSMLDGTTASIRVFFQDPISLAILLLIPFLSAVFQRIRLRLVQDPVAVSLLLVFLVAGALSARARFLGTQDAWRDMIETKTHLPVVEMDVDPQKTRNKVR